MQRSKLGISVGLLGASVFFFCLFSGYLVATLLVGYILLFEENEWLRKSALKGIILLCLFSILTTSFNLIPNCIGLINDIAVIFNKNFSIIVLTKIISAINSGLDIVEKILFLVLGVKAINQSTVSIPIVDHFVSKFVSDL